MVFIHFYFFFLFGQLLQNYKVHFVPGWDCHGLPIELKGKYHSDCWFCKLRCQMSLSDPFLDSIAKSALEICEFEKSSCINFGIGVDDKPMHHCS